MADADFGSAGISERSELIPFQVPGQAIFLIMDFCHRKSACCEIKFAVVLAVCFIEPIQQRSTHQEKLKMKNLALSLSLLFLLLSFNACHKKKETALTPMEKLIEGNKRFAAGKPVHPDETLERIRELRRGQNPFAIVVSCSDSRLPPELIFDQGLGDIFSVRTAGNVIGDYELGSIEYAVEHLNCNLIIVMGHEECGAIQAFIDSKGSYKHLDHIKHILDYLGDEKEEQTLLAGKSATVQKAVLANIDHGVATLKNSEPVLKTLATQKKIQIVGAVYEMETGKVKFSPKH
jgi:carbonic anhydrase